MKNLSNNVKEITSYLRSAVAAQVNKKIEFKQGKYFYFTFSELINGKIDKYIFKNLIKEDKIKKDSINVIIVAKTIKMIFESQEKISSEFEDLIGIYYVPAILNKDGTLQYDEKKLPWIPREFLEPMVEKILSIGCYKDYDNYISESIGRIHKINRWKDYIEFVKDVYETVTKSEFSAHNLSDVELENNIYILKDTTVNATRAILQLYDYIISKYNESKLYENFICLDYNEVLPLRLNSIYEMNKHCGQMGGEYPLSASQRECINHFTNMADGEILAVNGPPGTGKTTLLQSIVANMYVERALKKEKPPLIVASSTNNQAVTNIIESFSKINILGYGNLEGRWIEGVNSFAVFFPSCNKEEEANKKGYQYTNIKGENFVLEVESEENILKSKEKLLANCSIYFGENITKLDIAEKKIHELLCEIEQLKVNILVIFNRLKPYKITDKTLEEYLYCLNEEIKSLNKDVSLDKERIKEWREHFRKMPLLYKILKFLKIYRRKIATRNRMFIKFEETFLDEYMSLDEIEEKYSYKIKDLNIKLQELQGIYKEVNNAKIQYDKNLKILNELKIDIFKEQKGKVPADLDEMNKLMDKTLRYIEFWLSVHYYECRWTEGEYRLTENQNGTTYKNSLDKRYSRLSMIAPCYVMTFYQLPKNFLAYDGNGHFPLYNYIDLLIVDEAGQVSPEIAACSFALAKKAVVVGDMQQIKPIWSISSALDISLAIENDVISTKKEYEKLYDIGINASNSSVMKVASKSCKYMKFGDRGLFLREHRRCYDEIISYCNELVYKGNIEPMRGRGSNDKKYKLSKLPQMGYKQIETECSSKKGGSRYNIKEAIEISNWINENFEIIKDAYPAENVKNLIGIITPFKAQVSCIQSQLNKSVSQDIKKNISVGTIHTFQGAERRLIIMSTVYSENEKCKFIDANKNMLNVAVSRAKDSFLVFGNIDSLEDNEKKPSGLLKKYIINNGI